MSLTQISDLETQALVKIFSYLSARELASVSRVCQQWRNLSMEEQLWKRLLSDDWYQDQPINYEGINSGSYRAAYLGWALEFAGDPCRPELPGALQAWRSIKSWLSAHYPEAHMSLRPGASRSQVEEAGVQMGRALPRGLAALYRLCDGQSLLWDALVDVRHGVPGADQRVREIQRAERARKQAIRRANRHPAGPSSSLAAGLGGTMPGSAEEQQPGEEAEEGRGDEKGEVEEGPAGAHPSLCYGMFGGYSFYDHLAVTRFMPLQRAVHWTLHLRQQDALPYQSPCLIVAASFNFRKLFYVDLATGDVFVNSASAYLPAAPLAQQRDEQGAAGAATASVPAVAESPAGQDTGAASSASNLTAAHSGAGSALGAAAAGPASSVGRVELGGTAGVGGGVDSGVVRWFAEFGRRLQGGWYGVAPLFEEYPLSRAICLFPACPPAMCVAVTRGVRVTASVVFAPELSSSALHMFSYSIRMQLLSEEEQARLAEARQAVTGGGASTRVMQRCQLMSRHWRILDEAENLKDEVKGDGVIGMFPILTAGGEEFTYQSCTHQRGRVGYMEGEFRFVGGTVTARAGPEFDVACPRFTACIPDYLY